jgi:abhydrolase domain-containing protein 12
VKYVLSLGIPPSRIAIVGQSLGTAVASAVSLHFIDSKAAGELLPMPIAPHFPELLVDAGKGMDFAGVFLIASFPSLPQLLLSYRIAGYIPILSPLRGYHRLRQWLLSTLKDKWNTSTRLAALTKAAANPGRKLRLHILHARDDWEIPWLSGEENFKAADVALSSVNSEEGIGGTLTGAIESTTRKEVWLGEEKRVLLILDVLRWGGKFLSTG